MTKTEELLAVLDMPEEDKQLMWLKEHREEFGIDNHPSSYPLEGFPRAARFFLADLAFRLRDEVVEDKSFMWTCAKVYNKAWKYKIEPHEIDAPTVAMWIWFATQAKPIHWIIAALIAKQKEKPE